MKNNRSQEPQDRLYKLGGFNGVRDGISAGTQTAVKNFRRGWAFGAEQDGIATPNSAAALRRRRAPRRQQGDRNPAASAPPREHIIPGEHMDSGQRMTIFIA